MVFSRVRVIIYLSVIPSELPNTTKYHTFLNPNTLLWFLAYLLEGKEETRGESEREVVRRSRESNPDRPRGSAHTGPLTHLLIRWPGQRIRAYMCLRLMTQCITWDSVLFSLGIARGV